MPQVTLAQTMTIKALLRFDDLQRLESGSWEDTLMLKSIYNERTTQKGMSN